MKFMEPINAQVFIILLRSVIIWYDFIGNTNSELTVKPRRSSLRIPYNGSLQLHHNNMFPSLKLI